MGDHGSPPGPQPASHCHWDIVGVCLSISMWQERRLPAGTGRYFCHKRYFVSRKRFRRNKIARLMCFVPFKRFTSYRIGTHGRTSVINGSGQRPRRRPSLALIPPAAPAPPIYEVMGDHVSPPGPLHASHHHWILGVCSLLFRAVGWMLSAGLAALGTRGKTRDSGRAWSCREHHIRAA